MKRHWPTFVLASMLLLVAACSSSEAVPVVSEGPADDVGYVEDTDVVVVDDSTYVVTGGGEFDCVDLGGNCIDIEEAKGKHCEPGAQADVVIVDGVVVDVICYPPRESGVDVHDVDQTAEGTAEVPQNQSNTVVTFDETTDGVPFEGDMDLQAENVAIIGNGIDKTIIDGNISIDSNNARIRGVTINGNLTLDKNSNNATVAFCKIKGNLTVHANTVSVVNCQVFGNVEVKGNNAVLVNVGVGGNLKVEATAEVCDGNYAFADADGDYDVALGEIGDPLTCTAK